MEWKCYTIQELYTIIGVVSEGKPVALDDATIGIRQK